ncbi:type IV pilin protein [Psychrobacter sp. DM4]|uniref:type IV pilin protein n=1 Tax=Psychrobacter sp. DM4 TaxID=3440637 RepID=UPI003F4F896A
MRILSNKGFTLIEMMIAVAIIGVLAAIAYPSYQNYVIESRRADMMSEMHNIASEVQARKLALGNYADMDVTDLTVGYPRQGDALYNITIAPVPLTPPLNTLTARWLITATPIGGAQMANDGNLTLNFQGVKCRVIRGTRTCGTGDEWND